MASIYPRGNRLYCRTKDEDGKWQSKPTPFNVGQEDQAREWLEIGQPEKWKSSPRVVLDVDALMRLELLDDWFMTPQEKRIAAHAMLITCVYAAGSQHITGESIDHKKLGLWLGHIVQSIWGGRDATEMALREAHEFLCFIGIAEGGEQSASKPALTTDKRGWPTCWCSQRLEESRLGFLFCNHHDISDEFMESIEPPGRGRLVYLDRRGSGLFAAAQGSLKYFFILVPLGEDAWSEYRLGYFGRHPQAKRGGKPIGTDRATLLARDRLRSFDGEPKSQEENNACDEAPWDEVEEWVKSRDTKVRMGLIP